MDGTISRRLYRGSAAAALAASLGFALAILVWPGPGFLLHELAAVVILAFLVLAIFAALSAPSGRSPLLGRGLLALVVLIAMGAAGASLGAGALPRSWDALPLVILVILVGAEGEMIRVSSAGSA